MGFQQGLSGLDAAAKNLDVIGNNVANASTVGFKSFRAEFADLYANSLSGAGTNNIGIGTQVADVSANFTQGNTVTTSNPLDLAINGNGFFRTSTNGTITYSRNGQFKLDNEGHVVNSSGGKLQGYPVDASGGVVPSAPADLRVSASDIAPQVTTEARAVLNLDSRKASLSSAAFNINNTATYNDATSLSVYDSLGNGHTLTTYFVKTASNSWDVFGASDGVQLGAGPLGTLQFQTDGSLNVTASALPLAVSVPVATGATTPLNFTLNFLGTSQFGSSFGVNELVQDGYQSGRLTGFNISGDGVLLGRYSNGQSRAQGEIVLANFTNPQGLQHLGNNLLAETAESGLPLIGAPGTGALGVLQSGALEESNVDLTSELVNMITAQRVYQANAQTIRAQDQLLQTIVNLR
jgi:flagellar hook protein FlgE